MNYKQLSPSCFDLNTILTADECSELTLDFLEKKMKGQTKEETDKSYYKNSCGISNSDMAWEYLHKFTPMVESTIKTKLKPANPYTRMYRNTSTLNAHVDREGLDWTVSVCLFSNINKEWPLFVQLEDDSTVSFATREGEASLVKGKQRRHWREPLSCADDEFVIQMFLHWTIDDN